MLSNVILFREVWLDCVPSTFEALQESGDVGSGADQVAPGNHDHDIGNVTSIFENNLI